MKFTPEEMAIDAADADASKAPVIGRGEKEWRKFINFRRGYVRLSPELRKAFADDQAVNDALRMVLALQSMKNGRPKRKKSA